MPGKEEEIKVSKKHYNRLWILIHALEGKLFSMGCDKYCDACRDVIFYERDDDGQSVVGKTEML